jgi:hypothetical protein
MTPDRGVRSRDGADDGPGASAARTTGGRRGCRTPPSARSGDAPLDPTDRARRRSRLLRRGPHHLPARPDIDPLHPPRRRGHRRRRARAVLQPADAAARTGRGPVQRVDERLRVPRPLRLPHHLVAALPGAAVRRAVRDPQHLLGRVLHHREVHRPSLHRARTADGVHRDGIPDGADLPDHDLRQGHPLLHTGARPRDDDHVVAADAVGRAVRAVEVATVDGAVQRHHAVQSRRALPGALHPVLRHHRRNHRAG